MFCEVTGLMQALSVDNGAQVAKDRVLAQHGDDNVDIFALRHLWRRTNDPSRPRSTSSWKYDIVHQPRCPDPYPTYEHVPM